MLACFAGGHLPNSVEKLEKLFLSSADQRSVFKEIVNIAFFESGVVSSWSVPTMRSKGHNFLEGISTRFCNCLAKNLMRSMRAEESSKVSRKINKIEKIKVLGLAF